MNDELNADQKHDIRIKLVAFSEKLLGIKYEYGAEWTDFSKLPESIDCSEMVEGIFGHFGIKMPDGSQAQFDFTSEVITPQIGDLGFFGKEASSKKIYHVGMIFDNTQIIECRALDSTSSFKTGEVILRPIERWKNYKNFCGFRSHPKLK